MRNIFIRVVSVIITMLSTPVAAESLDELIDTLQQIDMHVADTGFQLDKEKYAFGAKRHLAEETTVDLGIGGKLRSAPETGLSNNYRGYDSQTNRLEQDTNFMNAAPMLGMRFSHKF